MTWSLKLQVRYIMSLSFGFSATRDIVVFPVHIIELNLFDTPTIFLFRSVNRILNLFTWLPFYKICKEKSALSSLRPFNRPIDYALYSSFSVTWESGLRSIPVVSISL